MQGPSTASLTELASSVAALAVARQLRLATAESCTGGLIASLLTDYPGVSAAYPGSVVAYANEAKRDLLGVPRELLEAHGAVSEPVALAMARGARLRLGADIAVSTTGVAGPGGGTDQKPVGLTYIAISAATYQHCLRFHFSGDRAENRMAATHEALLLLYSTLSTPNS